MNIVPTLDDTVVHQYATRQFGVPSVGEAESMARELQTYRAEHAGDPAPIDMVLHCPACGMQHIDKDNHEEIRIRAAELGVDREGDRAYSDWLEKHEWNNPPHRSHLCHGCGHIWRPADVPTNGVAAIATRGGNDSPIAARGRDEAAAFQKWFSQDPHAGCQIEARRAWMARANLGGGK